MKVSELIEQLKALPQDAEARYIFDSFIVEPVDRLWLARSGEVILASENDFEQAVNPAHEDYDHMPIAEGSAA